MPKKKNNQTTGKPSKNTSFLFDYTTPDYLDKPTKPIDVQKPINVFDYLNALVRIPEVQKDVDAINKEPDNEEKILEIHNKYWGIYGFFPKLLQNTKAFYKYNKYFHCSSAIHVFSTREFGFTIGNLHIPDRISEYRDGRHIILAVDITKKKQNIIHEFKELLKRTEKDYDIPRDTTKDKDTTEDIWKIYDYKTKDKLTLLAIARRMTGLNDNPAYCSELDACLQRVKRAYRKANKIINTVKREVEKTITENARKQKTHNELMETISRMAEEQRKKGRTITIADRLLQGIPKKTKRK